MHDPADPEELTEDGTKSKKKEQVSYGNFREDSVKSQ